MKKSELVSLLENMEVVLDGVEENKDMSSLTEVMRPTLIEALRVFKERTRPVVGIKECNDATAMPEEAIRLLDGRDLHIKSWNSLITVQEPITIQVEFLVYVQETFTTEERVDEIEKERMS